MVVDTHRHRGLRQQLVKELKTKGIRDERILDAFMQIPRHFFLEKTFAEWAYKDVAFPIDADQTISQPFTVAMQTSLLNIKKGDKVLEIGTGSGFQASVLYHIGAKVYTIERQKKLFEKTEKFLHDLGFGNVRTLFGDGYEGAPRFAPFDKIIITAGAVEIPKKLIDQLKPNGLMVIPLGDESGVQKMLRITKNEDGSLTRENFGNYRFVPFLKGVNI
ncbi:MAG TPA: protein-L-isoaspartate(D-aspartate) O-methyltransferase [Saprospiraceae bacterium]|mgnify:FL=1|jgi:protein-L-isoaspartate(D-aspartate) O-methyltransferase|nr:protein-L-isoaspartate(D-aspartate) O-methyltransferase [Saprospiraceae bacterium]HMT70906.1 protein-L-isoaspartate(D-aspartate) O-methyltransferase [Saprospiraceae bacterium]HQV67861.1 protein-L-isoaspartate(D-aspartate) O-methyltransferase [Saprospiraceae bacterium]HQV97704.1 protein-L-isoaspartate(D-aspartate) O-methyltransferase [Saprospiraceae bacterium]